MSKKEKSKKRKSPSQYAPKQPHEILHKGDMVEVLMGGQRGYRVGIVSATYSLPRGELVYDLVVHGQGPNNGIASYSYYYGIKRDKLKFKVENQNRVLRQWKSLANQDEDLLY